MALTIINDSPNPRGFAQSVLAVVFLAISWLAVLARLGARYHIKTLGGDDWLIVACQVFYTTFLVSAIAFHDAVPSATFTTWNQAEIAIHWLIVNEVAFAASMLLLKLSLGAFFLRIVLSDIQRRIIYIAVSTSTIWNLYLMFMAILACGNPNLFLANYTQAAINTLTDLTFAALSFFLLRNSRLPRRVKLYVGPVLTLASVGCVAGIVRFWYTNTLFITNGYCASIGALFLVGIVEVGAGIVACSLTVVRPLLRACAGDKTTLQSSQLGASERTRSSRTSRLYDMENNAVEDTNELHDVTSHDYLRQVKLVRTSSTTTENTMWSPILIKDDGTSPDTKHLR